MLSFSGSTCQLGALSPMPDPEVPASTSTSASMALFSLGTQTCAPPSLLLPRRAPSLQAPALDARPQAIVPVHLSAARKTPRGLWKCPARAGAWRGLTNAQPWWL
ncbi:hypothetical protein ZEAMMB73_Zm00001d028341 [Zea mays]|uniref:Uncharacterized protein n=1 Tax=Zea mays TaxID=4577 RepID=A0A1D6JVB9_MAIZE|nr:hypothetical protein ZEAMMB73_Zm00001d028341 [Zea mays]ONL95743.1 hypothetical protein ZEAMMB73_Zm00001d028341 [Zea mays]